MRNGNFSSIIKTTIKVIVIWLIACFALGWYDNNMSDNPNPQNNPNQNYTLSQDISTGRQQITNDFYDIINNGF